MGVDEFGEAAAGDLLGDLAEGDEVDPAGVDLERGGFGGGPHDLDFGERLADCPVSLRLGGRPGDANRRVQDTWWVRSTSGPWSHSFTNNLAAVRAWPADWRTAHDIPDIDLRPLGDRPTDRREQARYDALAARHLDSATIDQSRGRGAGIEI
jgi:hypothetical protein